MLKHTLGALLLSLVLISPAAALDFYGKVGVGVTTNTEVEGINLDTDMVYMAGVGTAIGPVRVQADVSQINSGISFANIKADNYALTAYADFQVTPNSAVSLGAGVDHANAEVLFGFTPISADGNGWHVAAGYSRRITSSMIWDVEARHTEIGFSGLDAEIDSVTTGVRFAL